MKTFRKQINQARISLNNQFWQSKNLQFQYIKLEKNFQQMMAALNMNQRLHQTYINIIKGKLQVKASSMQKIYKLLSQNKTHQIIFKKFSKQELINLKFKEDQQRLTSSKQEYNKNLLVKGKISRFQSSCQQEQNNVNTTQQKQQKQISQEVKIEQPEQQKKIFWLQRVYSRLAEKMVAKITFYILRKQNVPFIAPFVLEQSKKLQILMRRINDFKDLRFYYQFIQKIYQENALFEDKIYKEIVQKGYVLSIQQFYRVNGVEMLQHQSSVKRISRVSVASNSRRSIFSSSQRLDQNQQTSMRTLSRVKDQKKTGKKQKSSNLNNTFFLTKINKEIQGKYAELLDKISDFIQSKRQKQKQQDKSHAAQQEDIIHQSLSSISQDDQNDGQAGGSHYDKSRLFRFREVQKPARIKSNQIQFKYFSSQFSKVITDLDGKKGKTFKKNSGEDPFGQTLKMNTDAIAFSNPQNIAKLLMSGLNVSNDKSKNPKINQRDKNYSVKRLLKLYQARNAQNNIIELILSTKIPQLQDKNQKKHSSKRYSNINISMLRKLDQFIDKKSALSNRNSQVQQQFEIKNSQSKNRKKIDLNEYQNKIKKRQSDIQGLDLSSSLSNRSQKPMRQLQKSKQKLKKYNFYISPRDQANNMENLYQKQTFKTSINTLQKIQNTQNQQKQTDKVIRLLKQKTIFTSCQDVFKQFTNPLNQGYGFYCDKNYAAIRNSLQKKQKKYQILKQSPSEKTTFRNNKLIKKGLFKAIQEKQSKLNLVTPKYVQGNIKENKLIQSKINQNNKTCRLNAHQKFLYKKKVIQNDIKDSCQNETSYEKNSNTNQIIPTDKITQLYGIKYRKTHGHFNRYKQQRKLRPLADNQKQNICNYTSLDWKYKSQLNSIHKTDLDFPLMINATSIIGSAFVSPLPKQFQRKNQIIQQLQKDLIRLQQQQLLIRKKKQSKLSYCLGNQNKRGGKSKQNSIYSIYSTNCRRIIA